MSWILGIFSSQLSPQHLKTISSLHPTPLSTIRTSQLYLASGGIHQTCLHSSSSGPGIPNEKGWVVVGTGISMDDNRCRIMSADDWCKILVSSPPSLHHLDGHFAIVTWQPGQLNCYTDQLGLRSLYLAQLENGIAFSTRLDWIARLSNRNGIDYDAFGTHWLIFNQLSTRALLNGIYKLGAGGIATCTPTSLEVRRNPWEISQLQKSNDSMFPHLSTSMNPVLSQNQTLSLGLSGGLDSRMLLSCVIPNGRGYCSLHSFGNPEDPDVRIAREIGSGENFDHIHFHEPIPVADQCLQLLREYVGQTCAIEPASSTLKMRYFSQLHSLNKIVIDGGFGEIARRQYFVRLLKFGRKGLRSGNPRFIAPYLRVYRANIFNDEVNNLLQYGVEREIEELWEQMPNIDQIGEENFLDLLAIRTRFPNWGAYEQSRMDCHVVNYMPFAQPSLLRRVFLIPITMRRNGKEFKKRMRKVTPSLTHYPLVKAGITYPFSASTITSSLWVRMKLKIGMGFQEPSAHEFLHTMADFVRDTAHSSSVKSYPLYNHLKVAQVVDQYYAGRSELAKEVDWWLAFEVWRQGLGAT